MASPSFKRPLVSSLEAARRVPTSPLVLIKSNRNVFISPNVIPFLFFAQRQNRNGVTGVQKSEVRSQESGVILLKNPLGRKILSSWGSNHPAYIAKTRLRAF